MLKVKASAIEEAQKKLTEGLMYYHIIRKLLKQSTVEVEIYSDDKFKNFVDKIILNEFDFINWNKKYHNRGCDEILGDFLNELRYNSSIRSQIAPVANNKNK